jgi:hypothetical protein
MNDIQEVGGKAARNLIAAFYNQFQSDAPILSEEIIDQLKQVGDRLTELGTQLKVGLAPAIIAAAEGLGKFIDVVKQLGSFLGGFSADSNPKKIATALHNNRGELLQAVLTGGPIEGIIKAGQIMLESSDAAGSAAAAEDQRQKNQQKQIDAGKAAALDARKKRENSPPQFENIKPDEGGSVKSGKGGYYINDLQRIGAFIPTWAAPLPNKERGMEKDISAIRKMIEKHQKTPQQHHPRLGLGATKY